MEVAGPVEPVPPVEDGHVDDERVAFPAADRVAHVGVVGRTFDLVQVDRSRRVRERVGHLNLVRALDDLKRVGHVHRARNARQIALELGIAIDPVLAVVLLHRGRFRLVRNLAVTLDDANRSRHTGRSPEREHRRGGHTRVLVRGYTPGCVTLPERASCACRSQWASLFACQMPLKLGLPSAVRAGRDVAGALAEIS